MSQLCHLLDFSTLITFSEECKLRSKSLQNFIQPHVESHLCPVICLNILSSYQHVLTLLSASTHINAWQCEDVVNNTAFYQVLHSHVGLQYAILNREQQRYLNPCWLGVNPWESHDNDRSKHPRRQRDSK
jgi:hypothetical protein